MSKSAFVVRDGDTHHLAVIGSRDIGLLWGPLFEEGAIFGWTFGFYENFTVQGGIPEGSHVIRPGRNLFNAAFALHYALERDIDLLRFDYSLGIGTDRPRHGPVPLIVRGRMGQAMTKPGGFCYAKFKEPGPKSPRVAELIDLRIVRDLVTDDMQPISVHREEAEVSWTELLPPLLAFLRPRVKKRLVVEHIDRVE